MFFQPEDFGLPAPLPPQFTEEYRFAWLSRVIFADLDAYRHVNHVRYVTYLETARMEYLLTALDTREARDLTIILARQEIIYRAPLFFDDTLALGFRISNVRRSSFGFRFGLWAVGREAADWRLAAEGDGTLVFYDYAAQKSAPLPESWLTAFNNLEGPDRIEKIEARN